MFAKAKFAGVDMDALGVRLAARKAELMAQAKAASLPVARMHAVRLVES